MHRALCGSSQRQILKNLSLLDGAGAKVILLWPIGPEMNETPEHIEGIGKVAAMHACIRGTHLEPYHRLGVSKAQQLGQEGAFDGSVPERERLEEYCRRIRTVSDTECIIS